MNTKPAPADGNPVVKAQGKGKAAPVIVEGVSLTRHPMKPNQPSHPVAKYRGSAPAAGDALQFTLANGVTYRGTVSEATEADGEVLAEFEGGLITVPAK